MWRLVVAFRMSRVLGVAVELGIPELLSRHPHTAAQLAADTTTHEPSLRRLLRAMVAMELVGEDAAGRYSLTALGEELRADRLGPFARLIDGELDWISWQHLGHSIKTGERAFDHVHGMRNWQYYATHPADGAIFDAAMRAMTEPVCGAVANAYDFSAASVVADIGGGDGTMLIAILKRHAHLRGVLLDRSDVIERARSRFELSGVASRVTLVGGNFFEEVPGGADVYLMKSIIHDWDDDSSVAIMKRIRAATGDTRASLLLVERLLSARIGPDDLDAVLSDLQMLVNAGGQERTANEYSELFQQAGYGMARALEAGFNFHILEALPV